MPLLHYRAGRRALRLIRRQGLTRDRVHALIAPATGPKWLAVAGLDRALLQAGFLHGRSHPLQLVGASAGAWRSAALAGPDPLASHQALAEDYIGQHFTHAHDGRQISAAYVDLLARVLSDAHVTHALTHPELRLSVIAARARGLAGSSRRALQWPALVAAAAGNALSRRSLRLHFERTVFHSQVGAAQAPSLMRDWQAVHAPLTSDNLRGVLLASGTVPLYMAPVTDLPGAPAGRYVDGGLTDYHVSQPFDTDGQGVALLPLHQARVVPSWFDKLLPLRRASAELLRDVLLVYPDPSWVAELPGGQVPTREDFETFVDDPTERMRRWRQVVSSSERLGEQWLSDLQGGRIPDLVRPL